MSNTKSTDLSREAFEYKDSPKLTRDLKVLALIIFSMLCFVGTIVLIVAGRNGFWDSI